MENIYQKDWEKELMHQFLAEDKCKKKAYICSPFSADTKEGMLENMRVARAYMYYALKNLNMCARAPHAYLPMLLCDNIPNERAIALKFGVELLERSDVLLVCGNRISNGMKNEIANAAVLRIPIIVFEDMLYLEVQKIVTKHNGDKKSVKLDTEHFPMSFTNPISYLEQAAMFK